MKRHAWLVATAAGLLALSVILHWIHYLVFGDWHHLMLYGLGDIAFLPFEIVVVGLIVERLIARHERNSLLRKMNMLIGTFFSEIGTGLIGALAREMEEREALTARLAVRSDWTPRDFAEASRYTRSLDVRYVATPENMKELRDLLVSKRDLLVMLLANPNLLEHESFTELLRAAFHLMEELAARESFDDLPTSDLDHLGGDAKRVFGRLARAWIAYAGHLKRDYPYIFSVLVRTHPLQETPSPIVV